MGGVVANWLRNAVLLAVACLTSAQSYAETPEPAAPGAEAKASAPITIESFANLPFISGPELSPNGNFLATRINMNGETRFAIIPLFDKTQKFKLFDLGSEKVDISSWQWVNDDWVLLTIVSNIPVQGEDWRISRVIAINRQTGLFKKIHWRDAGQNGSNVIWVARDGTPRILLGIQRSIFFNTPEFWTQVSEVDVSTGKSKVVAKSRTNVMNYYADAQGVVRVGYGYNDTNRTATLLYRTSNKSSFEVRDRANVKADEDLIFPSLFLADPAKALTWSDAEGRDSLYELDLTTLKRGKKVFDVPGYDADGLIANSAGNGLAGVYATDSRTRIHWIDPGLAAMQADVDKAVGAGRALAVSWSQDQKRILFQVGGPDQAGAFYLYNRGTGGAMNRIGYVDEALKMRKFGPVSTIRYKARDGLEIEAVLTLPKDKPAKNLPLIVLPHGGPAARDAERWDWWVQFLAWRGYAVVQPNYRGSTGYGAAFFDKGDGEFGKKMQDDLNDAITHLASQGIADPKRVCIAGASYGGYAALVAGYRDGDKYRCAISYAGVADLKAIMRYNYRYLNDNTNRDYWKSRTINLDDVSPEKNAARFTIPTLLLHGAEDLRVPVKQSRQMAAALKSAGKAYRYVEQPKGDHHFSRSEDRLQFLKEMDAFLSQYNPAD